MGGDLFWVVRTGGGADPDAVAVAVARLLQSRVTASAQLAYGVRTGRDEPAVVVRVEAAEAGRVGQMVAASEEDCGIIFVPLLDIWFTQGDVIGEDPLVSV